MGAIGGRNGPLLTEMGWPDKTLDRACNNQVEWVYTQRQGQTTDFAMDYERGKSNVKKHLRSVSRGHVALAGESAPIFDPVQFLTFLVAILTAVDGLFQRKAEAQS